MADTEIIGYCLICKFGIIEDENSEGDDLTLRHPRCGGLRWHENDDGDVWANVCPKPFCGANAERLDDYDWSCDAPAGHVFDQPNQRVVHRGRK